MDHAKMEAEHGKSPWKELNAYHEFMMATWHPAKGQNDLAPLKSKLSDLHDTFEIVEGGCKAEHGPK